MFKNDFFTVVLLPNNFFCSTWQAHHTVRFDPIDLK